MLRVIFLLFMFIAPVLCNANQANKIVATVDGAPITTFDVSKRMTLLNKIGSMPSGDLVEYEKAVIDSMVFEILVDGEAKEHGITVVDKEVEAAINSIAKSNSLTLEQLRAQFAASGVNYNELALLIKNQLLQKKLVEREMSGKLKIGSSEMNELMSCKKYQDVGQKEDAILEELNRVTVNSNIRKYFANLRKKANIRYFK